MKIWDRTRAYGTPYRNQHTGNALGALNCPGDPECPGYVDPADNPFADYDLSSQTSPVGSSSGSSSWLPAFQTIEGDIFSFARLFNPVPPGTVMQTGPNGTYISRAQTGQPTPSSLLQPFNSGSGSTLLMVGVGLVGLLALVSMAKGRG